jgi:hypothetical protein
MNLTPPTFASLKQNLSLLVADWRKGTVLMRYFVISQVAATLLSIGCSAACFVALALDAKITALGLVCLSGACLFHAVGTWNVLKRRYQVRFVAW